MEPPRRPQAEAASDPQLGGEGARPEAAGLGSVLLVGNYGPSIAVARALSSAGYRIIVGDGGEFATVDRSRFCAEVWQHPAPEDAGAFMVALLDFLARRPEIGVVLPLRPRYLKLLGAARDQLNGRVLLAMADSEIVEACLDKQRMYAIAGEAGVPYQPLAVATDRAELVAAADTVGYPCIVRPVEDTDPPMPGQRKALICHDRDALQRTFVTWPETHSQLLVQRFAHGPRHNVHFAAHRGRIIGRVQTTALRTDALDGTGLGVEGMSVQSDERLEQHCDALIGKLGYTGVGLAQFLVPAEGEPSFLELNPRHGTALAFIQHLGLDLANAAIGLAAPGETWTIPEGFEYPVGQRYAWTSKDISGLRGMRSRGQLDLVEALRWFRRAARAAIRADVHLTWSARDPMPTLAVYASWIAWRGRRQKPYA